MSKVSGSVQRELRFLRFPEVKAKAGLCRMQVDRLEKVGKFPKRVQLGANSVGWVASEIEDWMVERIAQRGGAKATASNNVAA